jgi:hypothetical protein
MLTGSIKRVFNFCKLCQSNKWETAKALDKHYVAMFVQRTTKVSRFNCDTWSPTNWGWRQPEGGRFTKNCWTEKSGNAGVAVLLFGKRTKLSN